MDIVQTTLLFAVMLTWVLPMSRGCEPGQVREGCRIDNGECFCASGCYSEYRYSNREECRKALKGKKLDSCSRTPCLHQGTCSQTMKEPGYKCRCEGTGYYGQRCEYRCPSLFSQSRSQNYYPYECVLI
ncbi:unnamed protein product [Bemisia tabaci]|uniref:EGF-like domain-containing protein n=1 Tax=Bemisia tabaci TaxID=7038 RepID=A0A9P0F4L5_BEMTA|nr:PREDICTED: protein crumbs-like [Bemisia tabaci]CAH0391923.1 unnamed protein product [Bemisia tabaci]